MLGETSLCKKSWHTFLNAIDHPHLAVVSSLASSSCFFPYSEEVHSRHHFTSKKMQKIIIQYFDTESQKMTKLFFRILINFVILNAWNLPIYVCNFFVSKMAQCEEVGGGTMSIYGKGVIIIDLFCVNSSTPVLEIEGDKLSLVYGSSIRVCIRIG